jgi:hypothetical protein
VNACDILGTGKRLARDHDDGDVTGVRATGDLGEHDVTFAGAVRLPADTDVARGYEGPWEVLG